MQKTNADLLRLFARILIRLWIAFFGFIAAASTALLIVLFRRYDGGLSDFTSTADFHVLISVCITHLFFAFGLFYFAKKRGSFQ